MEKWLSGRKFLNVETFKACQGGNLICASPIQGKHNGQGVYLTTRSAREWTTWSSNWLWIPVSDTGLPSQSCSATDIANNSGVFILLSDWITKKNRNLRTKFYKKGKSPLPNSPLAPYSLPSFPIPLLPALHKTDGTSCNQKWSEHLEQLGLTRYWLMLPIKLVRPFSGE